jgi:hypothetical protein
LAVHWQKEALKLADTPVGRERLAAYEAGRPWRDPGLVADAK